jgi:hypothetical protein
MFMPLSLEVVNQNLGSITQRLHLLDFRSFELPNEVLERLVLAVVNVETKVRQPNQRMGVIKLNFYPRKLLGKHSGLDCQKAKY